MGDVVSLVEKAQSAIDEDDAKSLEEKIRTQKFDLNDFLKQLQNIKKIRLSWKYSKNDSRNGTNRRYSSC